MSRSTGFGSGSMGTASPERVGGGLSSIGMSASGGLSQGAAGTGSTQQDSSLGLWGSILKEASSSKAMPCKSILVLGHPNSGKSTVINHLRRSGHNNEITPIPFINVDDPSSVSSKRNPERIGVGLAMSYTYADVLAHDQDGDLEEPVARLGFYELESGDIAYSPLIRHVFQEDRLDSVGIIICLDWSKPWTFYEHLQNFLIMIQKEIESAAAASATFRRNLFDLKEKLENVVKSYIEPPANQNAGGSGPSKADSVMVNAISNHNVMIPLGQGVLTNNLGIPLFVVCAKSDVMLSLERERDFNDDKFDFIQQSLRTLCLKYGAPLFYTSTQKPVTHAILKSYILHRLFHLSSSDTFTFTHRAQVVDRDTVFVPTGWDNWGLIKVQNPSFDCEVMAGMEGVDAKIAGISEKFNLAEQEAAFGRSRTIYEKVIRPSVDSQAFVTNDQVDADDEQIFLERNLDLLNSIGGSAFSGTASPMATNVSDNTPRGISASSSSSDILEDVSAKLARLAKLKEQTSATTLTRDKSRLGTTAGEIPLPPSLVNSVASTTNGVNGLPGAPGATQNEVLANFFQSLLTKKSSAGASMMGRSPSVGGGRSPSSAGTPSLTQAAGISPQSSPGK